MKKKVKKVLKLFNKKTNKVRHEKKVSIGTKKIKAAYIRYYNKIREEIGAPVKKAQNIMFQKILIFFKKLHHVPKGQISKALWAKIILSLLFAFMAMVLTLVIGVYSPTNKPYDFELRRGSTVTSVANKLKSDGVIVSVNLFKASILFFGGEIQSGTYELPAGASTWDIAKMLSRGDISAITVLIPEGATVKQIREILYSRKDLHGTLDCDEYFKEFGKDLGIDLCDLKDGDFFPDTYRVAKGTQRAAVLKLSKKKMDEIKTAWQENSRRFMPEPLKSWNQVVTLASIVQKETPKPEEMPVVASVYLNRLKKKMKLQADPTVVYAITNGLGDMQGAPLLLNHLKYKSPYNTYINYGLPPFPIANVGRDAIFAVLNAADTNYLYFVADGTGGHKFADTYAQHQKNREDWKKIKKSWNSK